MESLYQIINAMAVHLYEWIIIVGFYDIRTTLKTPIAEPGTERPTVEILSR